MRKAMPPTIIPEPADFLPTPDRGVPMKRFTLLFVAAVLLINLTGCGSGSASPATTVSRAEDPTLPSEVREYEAKNAKRLADQAEKAAKTKAARSRSRR
jgi:hypothetical protein